jgi:hypothetical protein
LSERKLAQEVRYVLEEYLNIDLEVVSTNGSESKGSCLIDGHLILNLEAGLGSCGDPSIQNLAFFIKQLPKVISRQIPCLLLDISGPVVGIHGAMNTDDEHIICEPLCPILPIHHDVDNDLIGPLVLRAFAALRVAIESLARPVSTLKPRELSTFPYKTSATVEGAPIAFRYVKHVARYVFIVEIIRKDRSVSTAVVKFAMNYGKDVHAFCATLGFAPKLLAYEELPAQWHFILMEYVDLQPLSSMDRNHKKNQFMTILERLRGENFVHGDLRHDNVFWHQDRNRVILIDFDWSGKHGIQRYPSEMNPEVQWPKGASTGEVLSFDHDAFWIHQLVDSFVSVHR